MDLAAEVKALQERERRFSIIARRALQEWAATIDFDDHSERNVRLVAQWAWVNHDLERLQDEREDAWL